MRAPRMEAPKDKTIADRQSRDQWRDGSRIHIVSGVSVLEAKKIVRTLEDPAFTGERGQMVSLPSREMIERARSERERVTRNMRSSSVPARLPRAPPGEKDPCAFERLLTLIFLLTVLGLQLALLVRIDRWPG